MTLQSRCHTDTSLRMHWETTGLSRTMAGRHPRSTERSRRRGRAGRAVRRVTESQAVAPQGTGGGPRDMAGEKETACAPLGCARGTLRACCRMGDGRSGRAGARRPLEWSADPRMHPAAGEEIKMSVLDATKGAPCAILV